MSIHTTPLRILTAPILPKTTVLYSWQPEFKPHPADTVHFGYASRNSEPHDDPTPQQQAVAALLLFLLAIAQQQQWQLQQAQSLVAPPESGTAGALEPETEHPAPAVNLNEDAASVSSEEEDAPVHSHNPFQSGG